MPYVIPVFIPHRGCPHRCLFCNQQVIAGAEQAENQKVAGRESEVSSQITTWLERPHRPGEVQVAFYGGSFTCLPRAEQERLLAAVQPFLRAGAVNGIRLSTRPDCVDKATALFLRERGVRVVELGVQSLDEQVLALAERGHGVRDCEQAAGQIRAAGLELGVQLMPGLPGEDSRSFFRTVEQAIALAPAFVRIYPTLVIAGSALADLYEQGGYRPLSLNRALALAVWAKKRFSGAGIRVVRVGLQPSTALERDCLAGPYHPAFGELVASRIWLHRARHLLAGCPAGQQLRLTINERDLSAFVGQKRLNMKRLAALGLADRLDLVTSQTIARGMLEYVVG
ncbi:MAG: radical SAM protein [Desulfobulbaceae bacterium]|uniref:Radical SAM protein n=1 Tax=Candidatus Desulfatifera sulfidica TaxID=2841691 RepID=A0A8J6NBA7_9BACT|nr:radical SAM protein [Candidatus Desulfatifera sulfidica]